MSIFSAPVPMGAGRVALDVGHSLGDHRSAFPSPVGVDELLPRVADSGMRGFGGALFPVARKWQTAVDAGGGGIVVANGAESEPASAKDAALLQLRPHLVLDGLMATARATGSTETVLWLHQGAFHSRIAVERAIVERRAGGVMDLPVRIVEGPASYLTGESSSIVRFLSGGPALPRTRSVPAAVSGVDGRPTLVHNVETLARVGLLASRGEPSGTRLLTVSAAASGQTVVEVGPDATLAPLLTQLAGGDTAAVLLGGYGGTWHLWSDVATAPFHSLQNLTSAGIVMALPATSCGLAVTARIVQYLAASSARQCGPCLFGLDGLAKVMSRVSAGRARRGDVDRLESISAQVVGRGACHHPDGAVRMLGSAMRVFAADLPAHRRGRTCTRRHDTLVPGQEAA